MDLGRVELPEPDADKLDTRMNERIWSELNWLENEAVAEELAIGSLFAIT